MYLSQLKIGETARVARIEGGGALADRLKKLGLTEGVTVTVVRFAPLGDPMEIFFRNFTLAIRKNDAGRVVVEKI